MRYDSAFHLVVLVWLISSSLSCQSPRGEYANFEIRAAGSGESSESLMPWPGVLPEESAADTVSVAHTAIISSSDLTQVRLLDRADRYGMLIVVSPDAAERLREYTTDHLNERVAVVVGGRVASLPVIQSTIADGRIELTTGSRREAEEMYRLITSPARGD